MSVIRSASTVLLPLYSNCQLLIICNNLVFNPSDWRKTPENKKLFRLHPAVCLFVASTARPGLDDLDHLAVQVDPHPETDHPHVSAAFFGDTGFKQGVELFIDLF